MHWRKSTTRLYECALGDTDFMVQGRLLREQMFKWNPKAGHMGRAMEAETAEGAEGSVAPRR